MTLPIEALVNHPRHFFNIHPASKKPADKTGGFQRVLQRFTIVDVNKVNVPAVTHLVIDFLEVSLMDPDRLRHVSRILLLPPSFKHPRFRREDLLPGLPAGGDLDQVPTNLQPVSSQGRRAV